MINKKNYWKWIAVILVFYSLTAGLLHDVPRLHTLNETIRNLYYHVPMWFGMVILFFVSLVYSIRYLANERKEIDNVTISFVNVGLLFGLLGMGTGMLWAEYTWGEFWSNDPKQKYSAIALLVYFAFVILRASIEDSYMRAKVSSVYNIFAFTAMIALIFVLPRMGDSLHPGVDGNPAFGEYDLDNNMRWVFYPAVVGWTLLGVWMAGLNVRLRNLEDKINDDDA